jgi:hypothetical protein
MLALLDAWHAHGGSRLDRTDPSGVGKITDPGAAIMTGWHIYMDKDLRTLLGQHVQGKFAVRYCGGGSLTRCRSLLWSAIQQAGSELAAKQGSDPSAWRSDATRERIKFVPGLLPFTMRYTNRPTGIQQVVSFGGHSPDDTGR